MFGAMLCQAAWVNQAAWGDPVSTYCLARASHVSMSVHALGHSVLHPNADTQIGQRLFTGMAFPPPHDGMQGLGTAPW